MNTQNTGLSPDVTGFSDYKHRFALITLLEETLHIKSIPQTEAWRTSQNIWLHPTALSQLDGGRFDSNSSFLPHEANWQRWIGRRCEKWIRMVVWMCVWCHPCQLVALSRMEVWNHSFLQPASPCKPSSLQSQTCPHYAEGANWQWRMRPKSMVELSSFM